MPEEPSREDEQNLEDGASHEEAGEEESAEEESEDESEGEPVYEDPNEMVTIKTFVFPYQAQAAKLHMDEANIPAFLADYETVSMDWFLGGAVGNIKLQVRRCDVEAALTKLGEVQPDVSQSSTTDEESESTVCLSCGQAIPEEATACPGCGWSYADDQETHFRER